MAFAIVTGDGRYHGTTDSRADAVSQITKQKYHGARLLNDAEWDQVRAVGDNQAERIRLCGALGEPVNL